MTVCEKCGGTGKLRYDIAPTPGTIDLGDGMTMVDMGGSGTAACECVRDLPACDGTATWWDLESIFSESVPVPIGDDSIEVRADCEIPRAANGRRVHRTPENAYYPPLVEVELLGSTVTFHAVDARVLAAALVKAADACDERDAETEMWGQVLQQKGGK